MPENSTPKRGVPHADPRSPFVFDLRELGRRPGSLREYRRSAPAPAELGLDLIAVPEGASLAIDVRLESVTEGVLVTGTVSAPVRGECGRCLEPISDEVAVDVCELFAYQDSATDETTGADEVHRIDGEHLDAGPMVRDAIVLGLPFAPLCRPDCGGLCPDCGQRLDELPADHTHELLDPRWAALAAFKDAAQGDGPATGTDPDQLD